MFDEIDHNAVDFMSLHNSVEHGIFRNFLTAGFNHDDFLGAAGNRKLKRGFFTLCGGRVDDDFAVHKADKNAGDRAVPRNIRNGKGDGSADKAGNFRRAVRIDREDEDIDGYIVS